MKNKNLRKIIIALILSDLLAFAVYAVSAVILLNFLYLDHTGERDFTPVYIIIVFIFQFSFWFCYTRKNSDVFDLIKNDGFSWKECLRKTMTESGKIIVIVTAVLAAVFEASLIIHPLISDQPGNIVATALWPLFSIGMVTGLTEIPVLRTILAFLATAGLLIAQMVWQRWRNFRKWKR